MSSTPSSSPLNRERPRRRWQQFSLRSLMVLMLLCCLGLLLWNVYIEPYRRQHRLMAEVERLKGTAQAEVYDKWWMQRVFGKGFFINVYDVKLPGAPITDAWLAQVRHAPRLRWLDLDETATGDAGLAHVVNLRELQWLRLGGTNITDAGLAQLRELSKLEFLTLAHTRTTDLGLARLQDLTGLTHLFLKGCQVTDGGMASLQGLTELEDLDLSDTRVSDAGIARLPGLLKLQRLALDNTDVTQASLAHLKELPALKMVTISGTRILPSALWDAMPDLEDPTATPKLREPTVIEFVQTPLRDVVDYLKDYHRVEIQIDNPGLRAVDAKLDVPITKTLRGKLLGDALHEILEPLGLKCIARYGLLLITADEEDRPGLPRLIIGPGRALSKEFAAALQAPTVVEFVDTPLTGVCGYLSDYHKREFVLMEKELDGARLLVTLNLRGVPVATALELIFNDLDVHGVIEDDMIHVRPGSPKARQR